MSRVGPLSCAFGLLWMLMLGSARAASRANTDSQFQHDTGLPASTVQRLQTGAGMSHYRMRTYRFWVEPALLQTQLKALGIHMPNPEEVLQDTRHNDFEQAAEKLFSNALNAMPSAPGAAKTAEPSLLNMGGLGFLLPPYARTFVACYPSGAYFSFRIAFVHPQN